MANKTKGLEKRIYTRPQDIGKDDINVKQSDLVYADDEKLVYRRKQFNYVEFVIWGFGVFLFGQTFWDTTNRFYEYIFGYLAFTVCIYFTLNTLFTYQRKFVFNRKDGTITYPDFGWLHQKTIPFNDASFVYGVVSLRSAEKEHLMIVHANGHTRSILSWYIPKEAFSFYTWYMDKNRPLPPGTAFDAYREKDYLRRKAEGFHEPLYPADIVIPEYVYMGKENIMSEEYPGEFATKPFIPEERYNKDNELK